MVWDPCAGHGEGGEGGGAGGWEAGGVWKLAAEGGALWIVAEAGPGPAVPAVRIRVRVFPRAGRESASVEASSSALDFPSFIGIPSRCVNLGGAGHG